MLFKLYEISKRPDGSFRLGYALNLDDEHIDGFFEIDKQHEHHNFVRWAYEHPLEKMPLLPCHVMEVVNKKFVELEKPSWDKLLPDEYVEKPVSSKLVNIFKIMILGFRNIFKRM